MQEIAAPAWTQGTCPHFPQLKDNHLTRKGIPGHMKELGVKQEAFGWKIVWGFCQFKVGTSLVF